MIFFEQKCTYLTSIFCNSIDLRPSSMEEGRKSQCITIHGDIYSFYVYHVNLKTWSVAEHDCAYFILYLEKVYFF